MYIPSKPNKYGIKIVMMCDVGTKYMINAIPYLGKGTRTGGLPLGDYFVRELSRPIWGSNRNITMDNWFTSIPMAEELLKPPYNLTIVGTLRKNKREIPPELLQTKKRTERSSMFCFDQELTMVSYVPKRNKMVVLLSTMHERPSLAYPSRKPEVIEYYNSTKGGVDTFNQMCMSCLRKTKRWPLCVFYGLLNITSINSYVVYSFNRGKIGEKPPTRKCYMKELYRELVQPHVQQRLLGRNLSRSLREHIEDVAGIACPSGSPTSQDRKRKICSLCPSKLRRMTTTFCNKCGGAICAEHRTKMCIPCGSKI